MSLPHKIAAFVLAAAAIAGGEARAQYYSSVQQSPPPLYPYVTQPRAAQPYAVEVAPGTYVIQRPGEPRAAAHRQRARRAAAKTPAINTTKIVRHKPKVVETTRYVDDPPRVVERYTVVDDASGEKKVVADAQALDKAKLGKNEGGKNARRVIQADAEITIIGPDRMTIQLYRKGERGKPSARLN